jgi:hypothetical protein
MRVLRQPQVAGVVAEVDAAVSDFLLTWLAVVLAWAWGLLLWGAAGLAHYWAVLPRRWETPLVFAVLAVGSLAAAALWGWMT